MYYYGGYSGGTTGSCCGVNSNYTYPQYGYQGYGYNGGYSYSAAIILVLFILLVIIIGSRIAV